MSINKPNFVVTAQSTSELQLLPVWKTNVRHIGIRLPVLIRHVILHLAAKYVCYIDIRDRGRCAAISLPVSDWVTSLSRGLSLSANQIS